MECICDPTRPDVPDIRPHSQGLGNILRSSFRYASNIQRVFVSYGCCSYSFFTNLTKPRPDDNPLLIVFMVGGVSVAEVRAVNEFIANMKPNLEV